MQSATPCCDPSFALCHEANGTRSQKLHPSVLPLHVRAEPVRKVTPAFRSLNLKPSGKSGHPERHPTPYMRGKVPHGSSCGFSATRGGGFTHSVHVCLFSEDWSPGASAVPGTARRAGCWCCSRFGDHLTGLRAHLLPSTVLLLSLVPRGPPGWPRGLFRGAGETRNTMVIMKSDGGGSKRDHGELGVAPAGHSDSSP